MKKSRNASRKRKKRRSDKKRRKQRLQLKPRRREAKVPRLLKKAKRRFKKLTLTCQMKTILTAKSSSPT